MDISATLDELHKFMDELEYTIKSKEDFVKANTLYKDLRKMVKDFEVGIREVKSYQTRQFLIEKKEAVYSRKKDILQKLLEDKNISNADLTRIREIDHVMGRSEETVCNILDIGNLSANRYETVSNNPLSTIQLKDLKKPVEIEGVYGSSFIQKDSKKCANIPHTKLFIGPCILVILGCLIVLGVYLSKNL